MRLIQLDGCNTLINHSLAKGHIPLLFRLYKFCYRTAVQAIGHAKDAGDNILERSLPGKFDQAAVQFYFAVGIFLGGGWNYGPSRNHPG